MEKLINWIKSFEKMNGVYPSPTEILSQAEMMFEEENSNIKYKNELRVGEDSLYRHVFDFVNKNIPSGTQIGVNGYGGDFKLPNGCQIKFIPHTERNKEQNLRKSNTKYHIVGYLRDIMSIETTDLLKENVSKYVDTNY